MTARQQNTVEDDAASLNNENDVSKQEIATHVEAADALSTGEAHFVNNYTEAQRRKVVRKIDLRLIPMLALLYMMSYLDRANIGNAKIEGLEADLNMTGNDYNVALTMFFVPYIIFEIPSNTLLLYFKRPSTYLGILVCTWGTVMTLTGLVTNFRELVVCRVLLGIFEAGFFPAAVYLISQWYLPNETQLRIAVFYSSSALSGAFSGLLAYAIAKMDGVGGLEGWRWIFILEGIASVVAGVATFFMLVDTPALSTGWLSANEIKYLQLRQDAIRGNSRRAKEAEKSRRWQIIGTVLTDWQIYVQALIYWSNTVPNYGMKFTMPQIIRNMGYTSSNAQLMTVPPYVIGAISAFISSYFSDRFRWRMPFIVGAQTLIIISFAVLFSFADRIESNIGVCYFAIILACIGFYPINPGGNAWLAENLAGPTKKAQGLAYLASLGNVGGIIGSNIYFEREKPKYPTGFGASFAFAALGLVACLGIEYAFYRINQRRQAISEEEIRAKYTNEKLNEMGDRSPLFRYHL